MNRLLAMATPLPYVPETRFGTWFLATETWRIHVLRWALDDLEHLEPELPKGGRVVDIGAGQGHSLNELAARFQPDELVAFDADPHFQQRIEACRQACPIPVRVQQSPAEAIPLPDGSVSLILCHQTLHHIVNQEQALQEMFRVLQPGGALLLAESTRRYIYNWLIRLLFRHPMHVHRTAPEYLAMVRQAGFEVREDRVSCPYRWWSRPDIGFLEWIGLPVPEVREETLVNLVARKLL